MKKTKPGIRFPFKWAAIAVAAAVLLLTGGLKIASVLKGLDYFRIKEVTTADQSKKGDFAYLAGRNIFTLDLKKESDYIAHLYPAYKKVNLVRVLPNRLFIVLEERRAVAYLKLYRYFSVDSDQVLLTALSGPDDPALPVIVGLETKVIAARPGKQYHLKELALALNIIQKFHSSGTLRNYAIKRIDASNVYDIRFLLSLPYQPQGVNKGISPAYQFLEVRVGQADMPAKLRILAQLIAQLKSDLVNIKYIDLKFEDPVIKYKDDQNK